MTTDRKHLGAMFDAHTDAEFNTRDIEATMGDAPHLTHVPKMTGGKGREACADSMTTGLSGAGRRTPRSLNSHAPSARIASWTKWS